jgi:hypothetical protein
LLIRNNPVFFREIVGTHTTADVVEAAMLIVLYGNVTVLDPLWHVQHLGE